MRMQTEDSARGISRLYKSEGVRHNRKGGTSLLTPESKGKRVLLEERAEPDGGGGK